MATITLSLPDPMMDWVERQARSGRHRNAGDYLRDLIRRDQERATALDRMQALVTEGLESGASDRSFDEVMEEARQMAGQRRGRAG